MPKHPDARCNCMKHAAHTCLRAMNPGANYPVARYLGRVLEAVEGSVDVPSTFLYGGKDVKGHELL